jgi:hypothetical protein
MPRQLVAGDVNKLPMSKQQRQPAPKTGNSSSQLQQMHTVHKITSKRYLRLLVRFSAASPDFLAWSRLACERHETDCDQGPVSYNESCGPSLSGDLRHRLVTVLL